MVTLFSSHRKWLRTVSVTLLLGRDRRLWILCAATWRWLTSEPGAAGQKVESEHCENFTFSFLQVKESLNFRQKLLKSGSSLKSLKTSRGSLAPPSGSDLFSR